MIETGTYLMTTSTRQHGWRRGDKDDDKKGMSTQAMIQKVWQYTWWGHQQREYSWRHGDKDDDTKKCLDTPDDDINKRTWLKAWRQRRRQKYKKHVDRDKDVGIHLMTTSTRKHNWRLATKTTTKKACRSRRWYKRCGDTPGYDINKKAWLKAWRPKTMIQKV